MQNLVASPERTFVLWAQTSDGVFVSRDGGMSWRAAGDDVPQFPEQKFTDWVKMSDSLWLRVGDGEQLERSDDGGRTVQPAMQHGRIKLARSVFATPWGIVASGPGGAYVSADGKAWEEMTLWPEMETGAADFLHAYWMGRYYGFVAADAVE